MISSYTSIRKAKTCNEFWSRYFSRIFSPFISSLLIKFNVNANWITFSMIPFALASVICSIYIHHNPIINLLLISLLGAFINILDTVDGEVARYNRTTSKYGKYLDRSCHYCSNTAIYISYGIFSLLTGSKLTAILFIFIALIDIYDVASKDMLYILEEEKIILKKDLSFSKREKLVFSYRSIINIIVRIFFLQTSIPHVILVMFPFFYYFNLLEFYACIYLIQLVIKMFLRSYKINKKYYA
tara:strand:- start:5832 stop:6557 length:726 start_codon:yes stop_codon:yes gene_type:complete